MQSALRDDALTSTSTGFALRVGLPWIRSMPLACVREPSVTIDGVRMSGIRVVTGGAEIAPELLRQKSEWWFAQDRLPMVADGSLAPGAHDVVVEFELLVPYLLAGPNGGPLQLPLRVARLLELDHPAVPSVSRDVA